MDGKAQHVFFVKLDLLYPTGAGKQLDKAGVKGIVKRYSR
jgi:hypothetical protein